MEPTTRRGMLATMGVLATAGCSGLPGSTSGSGGSAGELRKRTVRDVSRSLTLERDEFEAVKLSFDRQTVLFFSVVAGQDVDVMTFRRPDFEQYRTDADTKLRYVGPLSNEGTEATAHGSAVSPGEPVVVVDNTTWGATEPADSVQVDLDLEAFIRDDRR